MKPSNKRGVRAVAAGLAFGAAFAGAGAARAGLAPFLPGPAYDPAAPTGYGTSYIVGGGRTVNDAGIGVAQVGKREAGANKGTRAFRWDAAGNAVELPVLGTDANGSTTVYPYNVNAAGVTVGSVEKWVNGHSLGQRAVRWDAQGNLTELGTFGLSSANFSEGRPWALTDTGIAAGYLTKYNGSTWQGYRAVRWDAAGNVTDLGTLNLDANGVGSSLAYAVNDSGVVVGDAEKFSISGASLGRRAVRWNAPGTLLELPNLGTDSKGVATSLARAVNTAGVVVGDAVRYSGGGTNLGDRPARWDAQGNITEMEVLGTSNGGGSGYAIAVNDAGVSVGAAVRWEAGGVYKGSRAVRWDAAGHVVELGNLGADASGVVSSAAAAIDDTGAAVGFAHWYVNGVDQGRHAVYWAADGTAVDLNSLIDPASGWTLTDAYSISRTSWIAGHGLFDPDGPAGPQAAYNRAFLIQVPEPSATSLAVAAFAAGLTARRRRRRRRRRRH